jgi:hypothetical protein
MSVKGYNLILILDLIFVHIGWFWKTFVPHALSVFSKVKVCDFENAFRCGEHGVHLMGQFHRILYNPDHRINFAEIFATIPVKFSVRWCRL